MSDALPRTAPRAVNVEDLAQAAGIDVRGNGRIPVTGIAYDSRLVRPGDLFAALRGSDFDGHAYIGAALERGASAILAEEACDAPVPMLIAPNSRAALAPVSGAFYGYPDRALTMIGLTGTDGKTTTAHLVRDILRHAGLQTGMVGTVGIEIGDGTAHHLPHQTTPESNLVQGYLREMVERGTQAAVLEATSHGLHMHRLDGVAFGIAGVTNITHEHLEYHGTVEHYRRAKAILVERVASAGGVVVLNADDEGARSMEPFAKGATVRWYSAGGAGADYVAHDVVVSSDGSTFVLGHDGVSYDVSLPLLGDFNVANALCAIAVCHAAGISVDESVAALALAGGVPGRMNRLDAGQPFNVVVDYAHTPESLRKILSLLRDLHPGGRMIVVSGSAGERDPSKRPLQGGVMADLADVSIVTSEDPRNEDPEAIIREIADGARARGAVDGESLFSITDRREAIRQAIAMARAGDCVLLAGKGHETSIIWGFEHRPWNEAEVAREELASLGYGEEAR